MNNPSIAAAVFLLAAAPAMLTTLPGCRSDGAAASATAAGGGVAGRFDRPGYTTFVGRGQLWVFEAGSDAAARFRHEGEPARSITLVGAGPHGMDIRSTDRATIDGYLAADRR